MNLSYYPGCTLKTRARNFEDSAIAAMAVLGINLVELPRWNCCGTVYSLAEDDLVHHIAPVRTLIRAAEQGDDRLVTLCAFCYNTLQRANLLMKNSADTRNTLNSFMDEESDYHGQVEVVHLLPVLRDDLGWDAIADKVTVPLQGLKVAPYYGCTLLRPRTAAIDHPENPTILQELLQTLGATVVDFPLATECCGSFQIVSNPNFVTERAHTNLDVALKRGADALILSCPLCSHNLDQRQAELKRQYPAFPGIPIIFFTQLLALSLGVDPEVCRFDQNFAPPRPLLQEKALLAKNNRT